MNIKYNKNKEVDKNRLRPLEELNRMKTDFISVLSHELKTPLAVVQESVSLLFDDVADKINEKDKRLFINAKENIIKITHMIDELLDISRIERGRFRLRYSIVDLNDLLEGIPDFFKRQAQEKNITLEYDLPKEEVNILIDAGRINQVIFNLVSNAIKFTEDGGRIRIELKVFEDRVRIGVIDTGIGIAKSDLAKIFTKFQEITSVSAEKKGLGLGLSIAKDLVEKHCGQIWAESRPGVGSKFYFTLPKLHKVDIINEHTMNNINSLLAKEESAYLINLAVLNYKEFKKKISLSPDMLFKDIRGIIERRFEKFFTKAPTPSRIILFDAANGECSIITSGVEAGDIVKLCRLLKEDIKIYFIKNVVEDVFIDFGYMPYPVKSEPTASPQLTANLYVRKLFIGAEKRRFERIDYTADVDIILAKDKTEPSETIDISLGGICLICRRQLNTDARVNIRLRLPKEKRPISVSGRVAWISRIGVDRYKVGLEFINLKDSYKKTLSKFVKSIVSGKIGRA